MRLTADSSPEDVLAMAHILARTRSAWGALETDDFIGTACLAFYRKRDGVATTARNFHNLMVRVMENAMRDQTRKELRQYGKDDLPLTVASRPRLCVRASQLAAGGDSASSPSLARHRRLVAQREHNRTYFYRTVGLQACEGCGVHVNRGHGAKRCDACATQRRRARIPRQCADCHIDLPRQSGARRCRDCGKRRHRAQRVAWLAANGMTNAECCRIRRQRRKAAQLTQEGAKVA